MTITFNNGFFVAHSIFDENEKLKRSGFKWDTVKKKWMTNDFRCAETLLSYCDSLAVFQIRFIKENLQKAVQKSASAEGTGNIPLYHQPNMKPYPYQQAGVEYILPRPSVILADQMGLGKALFIDTLIITPTGKKRIGDLVIGDKVIGSNGKLCNVTGVFPQGKRKLFRVTFNDGFSVLADDDHLWKVNRRDNSKSFILTTGQMLDKNLILDSNGIGWNAKRSYPIKVYYKEKNGNNKWKIPIVKPISFESIDKLPIEPYLLGLLLGDGCITGRKITITAHKNDFDETMYGIKHTEQKSKRNVRVASLPHLKKELEKLELFGARSNNKFIPDCYKYASIKDRISLIQGLMDTDGTPLSDNSSGSEYCTVSKRLACDICEVVHSLGGIVRIRTKTPKYKYKGVIKKGQKAYRLNIKLPIEFDLFRMKRKVDKYIKPTKYQVSRYISNIEYEKKGEAVCISVDSPDNLYVTEHGIVTHNTAQALLTINMRHPVEALIVCPSILKYNWLKEARKWMIGHITVYIYESQKIRYYKARMTNHNKDTVLHIINYDILEKFKDRLMNTPFNFFIADECFVYDTLIETNKGKLKIGEIVDKRLQVEILTYNHVTDIYEYKKISRYIKHEKKEKKLIKITTSTGKILVCTEEHKLYVNNEYKKVCEIKTGDNLFIINKRFNEGKTLGKSRKNECYGNKTAQRQPLFIKGFIKEDDRKQSNVKSRICRKNEIKKYWKNFFIKGRKRKNNCSTTKTFRGIEFTRKLFGASYKNERSTFFIPFSSRLLQGGYRDSRNKTSHRSRRKYSQIKEMEILGQEKNRNIKCVRVESIEVLEQRNIERYRTGENGNINLYDIEIEDNHNYFASDTLVSNCHYIKNGDSTRSKISQELAKKAKWKIFITGTPIYNKPKDLFVTLNLIDPNMFGDKFQFEQRYCGAYKAKGSTKYGTATNVDELNTILRANYMVRRLAKDVMKDLPEKVKDVIVINESDLNLIVEKEKKAVEDSRIEEEKLVNEIDKLRELSKSNQEYEADYKERVKKLREIRFKNFGELSRIRKELAIKKIPYVVNFVKEILDNSEDPLSKIVVFGHHTEVLEKLFTELKKYKPVIITGKISDRERQESINLFSQKNDTRVFIGSMGAAGTGVDGLQNHCNVAVFAELDWTPSLVDQAESRLQRIGQKETVWVYHIVADESLDSKIIKMMMEKEAVAKEILDYRPEQMYTLLINDK